MKTDNNKNDLSQEEFDKLYRADYEPYGLHFQKVVRNRLAPYRDAGGQLSCRKLALATLLGLLPFVRVMRAYRPRQELLKDLVAGLTVFVMAIPHGMGYGLLSSLGAVYGLYTSTVPTCLYFFLGTSRHLSLGVAAAPSIVLAGAVSKIISAPPEGVTPVFENDTASLSPNGFYYDGKHYSKHEFMLVVGFSLTCLIGVIQLLMGVFRLGFLTIFFSNAMINSYTIGVAVHVLSSQVSYLLGYKVRSYNGVLNLYYFYRDVILNIGKFEWTAFLITLISIVLLVFTKEWLQPRIDKVRWLPRIPFPMELILIIIATLLSYFLDLKSKGVLILGPIPPGLPTPIVPKIFFWPSLFVEAFLLAVLSYSYAISISTIYSNKLGYAIDSNQELLAIGTCNIVGSFFRCFVSSGAISRSTVQVNAGGMTQIVSLVQTFGMILLLLFIGPLFEPVPICILSAIIIVALKNIFWQLQDLSRLWKTSLGDFAVFIITLLATILLDADLGLIVGFCSSIACIVARAIYSHTAIIGLSPDNSALLETSVYSAAQEVPGVKVFRYEGALMFASFDYFKSKLIEKTGLDPLAIRKNQQHAVPSAHVQNASSASSPSSVIPPPANDSIELQPVGGSCDASAPEHSERPQQTRHESGDVQLSAEGIRNRNPAQNSGGLGNISAPPNTFGESGGPSSAAIEKVPALDAVEEEEEKPSAELIHKPVTLELQLERPGGDGQRGRNEQTTRVHHIVLDCSVWAFIDDTAVIRLGDLIKEYRAVGIEVWLAACPATVRKMFLRSDFIKRASNKQTSKLIFASVLAAVSETGMYKEYK